MSSPSRPSSGFAARIASERSAATARSLGGDGSNVLEFPDQGAGGGEGAEAEDDQDDYRAYMTTKMPPRLNLKPGWRMHSHSIQWHLAPHIEADLDRETLAAPQVITITTPYNVTRIEGFHLGKLMADLNRQVVSEVRVYCPKRWPGPQRWLDRDNRPKPKVTKIVFETIDGRTKVGQSIRGEMPVPVPQDALGGEPPEAEMDR